MFQPVHAAELLGDDDELGEHALAVAPEHVDLVLELRGHRVHGVAVSAADHEPRELDRGGGLDTGTGRKQEGFIDMA